MSKNRSPRMLKKLKLGQFKEFGFSFSADFTKTLDMAEQEQLVIDLIDGVIEKRGLAMGGWIDGGFITKAKNGSANEEDIKVVEAWLKAGSALKDIKMGALEDAWYD